MGVTIFEALTLSRPFHVPDYVTFLRRPAFLAGARPLRPGEIGRGFPEEIEEIIFRAMDRDPATRYEWPTGSPRTSGASRCGGR